GAPVVLTGSWVALVVLVAVVYGAILERPDAAGWLMGLVAAGVVTVAVLVHELAHGLVGYALRMRPREFVLTFVGGHTTFDTRERGPWSAAAITAAGPVANAALAGLLLAARPYVEPGGIADTAVGVGAVLNLVLAISNILPALPLDGGRLWLEIAEGLTGRPLAGLRALGVLGRLLALAIGAAAIWLYVDRGGLPGLVVVVGAATVSATLWSGGSQALKDARAIRGARRRDGT
ncbi:MAG: site-2 protease family protein, partial [Actinomycetaceae bacterium]